MIHALEQLDFRRGSFSCLHVSDYQSTPTEYGTLVSPAPGLYDALIRSLNLRFTNEQLFATYVEHATSSDPTTTAAKWLADTTGLSQIDSQAVIDSFPVNVAELMNTNARNPTQFLGLAAAIAKNPDVILYQTPGMDPAGIKAIHRYAPKHYDGCLLHLANRPIEDELCPDMANCITIVNSAG